MIDSLARIVPPGTEFPVCCSDLGSTEESDPGVCREVRGVVEEYRPQVMNTEMQRPVFFVGCLVEGVLRRD